MKQLWVVLYIWYICVNENYLFTRAGNNTISIDLYDKSKKISCNSSWIYINDIYVREESVPCKSTNCKLNGEYINAVNQCNGKHDCNIDWEFNSACILEYGFYNISYICKASCDFEVDTCGFVTNPSNIKDKKHGWDRVSSFPTDKTNTTFITDHKTGTGYFMIISSKHIGVAGLKSEERDFESIGSRCLSFWYYPFGTIDLDIHNTAGIQRYIPTTIVGKWQFINVTIYFELKDFIIFRTAFKNTVESGVALDDVSLSYRSCGENVQVEKSCQLANRPYTFYAQDGCPSILIGDLNITSGMSRSDPRCQNISQKVQKIVRHCRESEEPCEFILTNLTTEKMCFQLHKTIIIEYLCTDNPMSPTTSSDFTHQADASTEKLPSGSQSSTPVKETTTSVAILTETVSSTPLRDVITDSLESDLPSSTPVTGIVVGVVLSLVALSVILVITFIYFRRTRYAEKKGHSIVANEDSQSDYTGHQNTAFSPDVDVTTQTDYCEIRTSKHNDQYHDITDRFSPSINTTNDDEYSEIANVVNPPNSNPNLSTNYQHQYISLDPNATGFDRSNQKTNLHNESKNNHNSDEKTSFMGGDDYAILDPDDLNESKNKTPKVLPLSENYVVLDPSETGFNRQENIDTVCNYELATPINPTMTSEDPYDVSKDETYDTSSNSRHKEKENNIYSHMVDNVYDTAGNQRKKEDNDGTYDHFYGQQSEDDYDISKPL